LLYGRPSFLLKTRTCPICGKAAEKAKIDVESANKYRGTRYTCGGGGYYIKNTLPFLSSWNDVQDFLFGCTEKKSRKNGDIILAK
jgi:hypothetical protein